MLNELGCWTIAWEAIGAVGTAAAAIIALVVWVHGLCLSRQGLKKRTNAALHLMVEELVRTSHQALEIWRVLNARNFLGVALSQIKVDVELALEVRRAEDLATYVERLPSVLGVELSKFISDADMLRYAFALVERNLIPLEGGKTVNSVDDLQSLAKLCERLMSQAAILAIQLELAVEAEQGSVKKKVASLEKLAGSSATVTYR